jgi:hypothetical protein
MLIVEHLMQSELTKYFSNQYKTHFIYDSVKQEFFSRQENFKSPLKSI